MRATPQEGYVLRVVLPGLDRTLWWGPDVTGQDVVAADRKGVLSWPTPEMCLASVMGRGWAVAHPDPTVMDLRPVAEWSRRRGLPLNPVIALDTWNLAEDIARSLGFHLRAKGRVGAACYGKLFAASVPWAVGRTDYRPRWSKHQMGFLRRQLGEDLALIARECDPPH